MRTLATLAVTLALFCGLARAQDKVELKPSYKAGESYTFHKTTSSDVTGTMQGKTVEYKERKNQTYTDTILEVKDNQPTKIKRTYQVDETVEEQTTLAGVPTTQKTSKPYVGQTFTLVKHGDKVKVEEDSQTAMVLEDHRPDMAPSMDLLLPDHAVETGESWKLKGDRLRALFRKGKKDSLDDVAASCTYAGMTENAGKKVAKIQVKMTMKTEETYAGKKSSVTMTLAGPLLFDPDLGLPVSMDLEGTLERTSGSATSQGPVELHMALTPGK